MEESMAKTAMRVPPADGPGDSAQRKWTDEDIDRALQGPVSEALAKRRATADKEDAALLVDTVRNMARTR
jgi:hypothetical protein